MPKRRHAAVRLGAPVVVAALVAATSPCTAQPAAPSPGQATPADVEAAVQQRAEQLNDEGRALFEKGKYEEAAGRFQQAWSLHHDSKYLFNLGYAWLYAYQTAGKHRDDAMKAFQEYLLVCRQEHGGTCPDEARVRSEIDRLQAKVVVESTPPGAAVFLRGDKVMTEERQVGVTPLELYLPEGKYHVRLVKPGYVSHEEDFAKGRFGDVHLSVALKPVRHVGALVLRANVRGARVYVDGNPLGRTPLDEPLELDAGKHRVTVEKDDYTPFEGEVLVEEGKTARLGVHLRLRQTVHTVKWPIGWTLVGVGLAGVGAGIALNYLPAADDFNDTPQFKRLARGQKIAYFGGAGLAAVGAGLVIWELASPVEVRPEDRVALPWVAPLAGGGWMAGFGGRW